MDFEVEFLNAAANAESCFQQCREEVIIIMTNAPAFHSSSLIFLQRMSFDNKFYWVVDLNMWSVKHQVIVDGDENWKAVSTGGQEKSLKDRLVGY